MIRTFSTFYFGLFVDSTNSNLAFDEGGPELNAAVDVGSFTHSTIGAAVSKALNAVGANTYTVTVDRDTRIVTISADGTFDLLVATGATITSGIFGLLGFTGADRTGTDTYDGNLPIGSVYSPQFKLQSFVDEEDFRQASDASVNKTASGAIEVISFGIEKFFDMDIKFITNKPMDGKFIKNNPTGVEDARLFLRDITLRRKFEFMPDIDDRSTFFRVILDKIPGSATATGYKLKELFTKNLPDIFETGVITLRVID